MYTINEAHSVELFQQLRNDLSKLSLGTYFAQVADVVAQEDQPNPELLSLVLNSLLGIAKLNIDERKLKAVFELRTACIAGYTPDLSGCHGCGDLRPDRFDLTQGVLECVSCRDLSSNGIRMPISAGVLDAMRYIVSCDAKKIFAFDTGEQTLEDLSHVTESYLTTQLERGFSALDFYKSLQPL